MRKVEMKPETYSIDSSPIYWFDFEKRKINGWMRKIPKKGDFILSKIQSGKTAKFKIKEVEQMIDPPDQFFATVEDIGYEN